MTELEDQLQEASLRSHDEVTATITGIDFEPVDEQITVQYKIGTGTGGTIESEDPFELPERDSTEYDFVQLCREADVSLHNAVEGLVGTVVDARGTDEDWYLAAHPKSDDPEAEPSGLERVQRWSAGDDPHVWAFLLAAVLGYPVAAPFVAWYVATDLLANDSSLARAVNLGVVWCGVGGILAWALVGTILYRVGVVVV